MTTSWTASDGTAVSQCDGTVEVDGVSSFAEHLRRHVACARRGLGPSVEIQPPPGGGVLLDLQSTWLVDRWVQYQARLRGLEIATEYTAPLEDAPAHVRELLTTPWPSDEGVIY